MTLSNPLSVNSRNSDHPIRFFFDESLLGVGKAIAMVRPDSVYAGHPRCMIATGDLDIDWLPVAARESWVVILRDKHIRYRPTERKIVASLNLRLFILTKAGNLSNWEQLRLLVSYWNRMENIIQKYPNGPWIYKVNKAGVNEINYPDLAG